MKNFKFRPSTAAIALVYCALLAPLHAQTFNPDAPMTQAQARAILSRFGFGATPSSLAQTEKMTARQFLDRAIKQRSDVPATIQQTIAQMQISQPLESQWAQYGPRGSEREKALAEAQKVDKENTMLVAKNQTEQDVQVQMASMQNDMGQIPSSVEKNLRKRNNEKFQNANAAQLRRDAMIGIRQYENLSATQASTARLLTMANSDNQGHEALLHFWINHFSVFGQKNQVRLMAWDYAQALEQAMPQDSFAALLRASFYHPAMQQYLDNERSVAPTSQFAQQVARRGGRDLGINENLARELLELHTLGVDSGYTQKDVQELARIITGFGVWTNNQNMDQLKRSGVIVRGLLLFDIKRHDTGSKTLLGQKFEFNPKDPLSEVDRALALLANHPVTAQRVSTKLARRFLLDEPSPDTIQAMSTAWKSTQGNLTAVLSALINSQQFARSLSNPSKFKEPVDYILSSARATCGDAVIGNGRALLSNAMDMGQAPFNRVTPDGYGSLEVDWLSPAAMAKRVRLALNMANERLSLAAAPPDTDDRVRRNPRVDDKANMRGQSCNVDPAVVQAMVGPVSNTTQSSLAGLSPKERNAVLLASPEFMHR